MSLLALLGVVMMAAGFAIVAARAGWRVFATTGGVFIGMCVVMHALCEVANTAFPGLNDYRTAVRQDDVDAWMATVGFAVLLFAVGHAVSFRPRPRAELPMEAVQSDLGLLDWRILAPVIAPAYLVAVSGANEEALGYWTSGLVLAFLSIGLTLAALSIIVRSNGRYFLAVVCGLAFLVSLIGQRLNVVASLVIVAVVLLRYRVSIAWSRVAIAAAAIVVLVVAISTTRALVGRGGFQGDARDRVGAIATGVANLGGGAGNSSVTSSSGGIAEDFVYRFDGNAFPAMMHARVERGVPHAGLGPIQSAFFVAIPQFLLPSKLDTRVEERSDKAYLAWHFGLPDRFDYLSTIFNVVYGSLGAVALWVFGALWGLFLGRVDTWLASKLTAPTLIVSVALTHCVLFMEQGIYVYTLTFRAALLVLAVLAVLNRLLPRQRTLPRPGEQRFSVQQTSGTRS